MRCAAEIKRRHYSRNIARSFTWMGYTLVLKKQTLRSFYTQMHKRFAYKCSGLRYAPDVSLLLLFKIWDPFTPITYTMGFKTDTKVKICVQVAASSSLCMNVLDCTEEKNLFRFFVVYIHRCNLIKCTARKQLLWKIIQ